ncbi:unnamed protein product [Brassica oleracea var. botrytis]
MAKETSWFGPGSRIIITTQDQKVLKASGINHIHKVNLPSDDEALQMFCMYAFDQKYPKDGFEELAWKVRDLVGRLPLGLKVIGSYFRGMSEQEWIKALPKLRTHLDRDREISSILKFSYDALHDEERSLFLHIACFFNDEPVDIVEGCLAKCFLDVTQGIRVLVEKSLISIEEERIKMSKLLVQLGRQIVQNESVSEPGKRQFLNDASDSGEVLSDDKAANSSVIGINLEPDDEITWTSERAFERLSNLQFLRILGKCVEPQSMNYLSKKLRVLIWRNFKITCFPSSFNPKFLVKLEMHSSKLVKFWEGIKGRSSVVGRDLDEKITCASERAFIRLSNLQFLRTKRDGVNLQSMNYISRKLRVLSWPMFHRTCFPSSFNPTFQAKLEMPFSKLEKLWGETKPLNLKWMELSYSNCLKELPDFSTATNLYELDLTHSSSLVKLSSSIGNAINLQNLNLSHCSDLVEIPSSIITNLKSLDFYGYSSLVEVPFNIEEVIDSIYINLSYCSSMVEVPSSTENAINLQELNLNDCSSLVEFPFSIGNAFYLQKLNMSYCASLVELPSSTGNTANFEEHDLDHCRVELPSSMRKLGGLSELELKECSKLEVLLASINLESLGEVNLSDWSLLKNYPENSTDVQETDPWIGRISGLRKLVQSGMEKLESLPPLPDSLWALDAENGESLERLGSSFRNPDINLSFLNYFKQNQEEKDLIIQTPSNEYAVFPGEEMPQCFTYRSSGSSLTVKLNQTPLGTSTKFKACIVCAGEDEKGFTEWERASVCCSITTSGGISLSSCLKTIEQFLPGHLYTFEFEVETDEVTSTELVFECEVDYADLIKKGKTLEIKECGIMLVNMIESFGDDNKGQLTPINSCILFNWLDVFVSFEASNTISIVMNLKQTLKIEQCTHHTLHVHTVMVVDHVRTNFLSHVLKELRSKGIDSFIDNDIERSKLIGPELVEAIRGSRIAIVLLSRNYASSTWCLNELVEIMKCREEFGQTVMPLFYELDPTDVKKQTGDFGKVLGKTCRGKEKEDIQRWKRALTEVAQIAGFHSAKGENEAELIEYIATDVSNKLNLSAPCSDFDGLVGMKSRMAEMRRVLQLDSDEVRKIGILGPPGIGKTTIARSIFNRYSQDFQLSVFMDNIKKKYVIMACSDDYSVKLDLQKQFMSQLTNDTGIKIPHLGVAKDRLKDKKVLVVLDDVDQLVQLEAMAKETSWFGPGSRIIITTQDENVLKASGIDHIHRVNLPSDDEALQMFCLYAFGQKYPKDGFKKLACEVRSLVGGLPLGLRVMGSYFRGMSEQDWREALPRLKIHLDRNGEIAGILKFSYDALNDEDKRLFLHIACFFSGEPVDMVERCLEKCFQDVRQGLRVLSEKSLIYSKSGLIMMSTLLFQLGRQIVQKESISEPGKRQFLNDAIDIGEVLSDDKAGNSSVIGIDLEWNKDITWTSERAFERLSNLQFIRILGKGVNPLSMNYISRKLKVLIWPMFPMPCFPSRFNPEFLVNLFVRNSNLEKLWEENKPLKNIKWMDLALSRRLKELPDLSTAINLYYLDLSYCSSLVKLPSSIGNATNLEKLSLNYCSSLVKLPSSIGNAINLKTLSLKGCSSMVKLPSSIWNIVNLEELNLENCSNLVEIPSLLRSEIEKCTKSDCSRGSGKIINRLPIIAGLLSNPQFEKNNTIKYSESSTNIEELDPWIGRILRLRRLVLSGMRKLVSLPQLPDSLLELDAENCESLERLHCSFPNQDIRLNFANCFKLNQEARDLIIQMPTNKYAVFPTENVPICFSYRSSGSSLTVKLNRLPVGKSTKFKACILCAYDDENNFGLWETASVFCTITFGGNASIACNKRVERVLPGNLCTFEVEVETEEVTSTKLVFDFGLLNLDFKTWKIKECGILQLL